MTRGCPAVGLRLLKLSLQLVLLPVDLLESSLQLHHEPDIVVGSRGGGASVGALHAHALLLHHDAARQAHVANGAVMLISSQHIDVLLQIIVDGFEHVVLLQELLVGDPLLLVLGVYGRLFSLHPRNELRIDVAARFHQHLGFLHLLFELIDLLLEHLLGLGRLLLALHLLGHQVHLLVLLMLQLGLHPPEFILKLADLGGLHFALFLGFLELFQFLPESCSLFYLHFQFLVLFLHFIQSLLQTHNLYFQTLVELFLFVDTSSLHFQFLQLLLGEVSPDGALDHDHLPDGPLELLPLDPASDHPLDRDGRLLPPQLPELPPRPPGPDLALEADSEAPQPPVLGPLQPAPHGGLAPHCSSVPPDLLTPPP